jgi:hypothetical protein
MALQLVTIEFSVQPGRSDQLRRRRLVLRLRHGLDTLSPMRRRGLPLACGLLVGAVTAEAHHSISGMYDSRREGRIEGVVTRFDFINPHAFLTLEVRQAGSAPQRWQVELDDRGELSDIGMTADTLQPGDRVIVVGSLARRETNRLYLARLDRPADGYSFEQVRGRPRLRSRGRS